MASRRSRIKGIANIPQRRKPTAEQTVQPEDTNEETNLKSTVHHDAFAANSREKCRSETSNVTHLSKNAQNDTGEKFAPIIEGPGDNEKTCATDVAKTTEPLNNTPALPPPASRRRWCCIIKPAISLKAIHKSSASSSISPAHEEFQIPKPQDDPSPPENACYSPSIPRFETQSINSPKQVQPFDPVDGDHHISKDTSVPGITKLPLSLNQNVDNSCTDKNDDVVRPPPACSPSKYMNRARIKAVPRLGQRRPSFSIGSASESEDESKKPYKNHRIRNDSVCSTLSTPAPPESPAMVAEASSQARKKAEFNSVIQRKCRRTEQSRKLAEARRDFQQKFSNGKPDKQKLTMIDLIFYNPTSSPMSQKRKRNDTETESISSAKPNDDIDDAPIPPGQETNGDAEVSDEENTVPAPQITIGANGEIIIDEKSLFIENKDVIRERLRLENSSVVDGDKFDSGYGVFKRVKRSKDWNKEETLRFYKALNTLGTDFTLMGTLFPGRSRRELKMKFKKEERINRALVDRAVMQPIQFDISDLKLDLEKQELDKMRNEQLKKDELEAREQRRIAKENKKLRDEELSKKRRRSTKKVVEREKESNIEQPVNAKEALRNKLRKGINSLIDSDSDEDVIVADGRREITKNETPEINENNNHIDRNRTKDEKLENLHTRAEEVKIQEAHDEAIIGNPVSIETQEIPPASSIIDLHQSEEVHAEAREFVKKSDDIQAGSMVLSSTIDETGKENYTVYSVNKNGEKIPIELNPDILEVLLKTQKANDADNTLTLENPDESIILPSDNTIDNIMSDISLSNIHDHPDLNLTSADCMILSFEDIDSNIATDSSAKIVAIETGP